MNVGFIGGGRMAQALITGFTTGGVTNCKRIVVSCAKDDVVSIESIKKLGAKLNFNNDEVVKSADVTILAVKPNVVPSVLREIKSTVTPKNLIVSIAMGVTLSKIEESLPVSSRVVRVMPNTPALVQKAATVYTPGSSATEEDSSTTEKLFKSVGICHRVPEYLFDQVTALSGSGPAYIYLVIEALADGAVRMGLPRDIAQTLASQTVLGAGAMVAETGSHPAELKDNVSSPGGSTCAGLYCLEEGAVRHAFIKAIQLATEKCRDVSAK